MLWYDSFKNKNSIFFLKSKKLNNNYRLKKTFIQTFFKKKDNNYLNYYVIPSNWSLIIVRNNFKNCLYINLYSKTYWLKLPIYVSQTEIKFDYTTNQLFIKNLFLNNFVLTYYKILNSFYQIIIKPNFKKIKFKGKGYYIYKNYRNTITPQFGYSHRLYLYAFYTYVIFLSKTSLIVFGLNKLHISNTSKGILGWRPINIFTGRGVRLSNQIIYKKSGKVSTYR